MPAFDLDSYVGRSRAVDLAAIDWAEVPRHPVPAEALRTLRYMQDIESHTIIYLRALLATRAIDDPDVATFLACWVYEETFHGLALARFLEAAGSPVGERPVPRGQEPLAKRIEAAATAVFHDQPRPGTSARSRVQPVRGAPLAMCSILPRTAAANPSGTCTGSTPRTSLTVARSCASAARHSAHCSRCASTCAASPA